MILIASALAQVPALPVVPDLVVTVHPDDCPVPVAVEPGDVVECVGVLTPPSLALQARGAWEVLPAWMASARVQRAGWMLSEARVVELEAYAESLEKAERRQRVRVQLAGGLGVVAGVALTLGTVWAVDRVR